MGGHSLSTQITNLWVKIFSKTKGVPAMAASRIQRYQRWALMLGAYEYHILYRSGKEQANADALSRLPLRQNVVVPLPGDLFLLREYLETQAPITADQIWRWTDRDPVLAQVRRAILQGRWDVGSSKALQPYVRRKDELSVLDGCMLWGARVVIPPPGREAVMNQLHDSHPGIVKLKGLARSYVWWKSEKLSKMPGVTAYTSSCTPAPMGMADQSMGTSTSGLCRAFPGLYVLSPGRCSFQVDGSGSSHNIFVNNDHRKTKNLFATHGIPQKIVTDNGPQFTSK